MMLVLWETEMRMWWAGVSWGGYADGGGWGDEDGVGQGWTRWVDSEVMEAVMVWESGGVVEGIVCCVLFVWVGDVW